ncbi:MAG: DUF1441 family protein [Gammaproteobacteria bacterium]|nr:DUF1441 family protein [Gammaproteobacteria bacterium]
MSTPAATPINELLWSATRYSDVLQLDRRVVAQALEKAPSTTHNGTRVWHVREGMPAIFKPDTRCLDPDQMEPKEALDYYRAQREKLRLNADIRHSISAAEAEQTIGAAFKVLAQALEALPDALERDCGLPPTAINAAQHTIDTLRESLYQALMAVLEVRHD